MHRELKELMRDATGQSSFVVAVNIDIRGFSSSFNDSSQAAAYLSSAYTRMLEEYFPEVSFFKPTGDGLLLVIDCTKANVQQVVDQTVSTALRLSSDFADICGTDPMINFPVPDRIGIGVSRGTATRISNGDYTLDYSGRPLNLASRLMDLARPQGVVFDASLIQGLAKSDAVTDTFAIRAAYLRGISESEPLEIYCTNEVELPASSQNPYGVEERNTKKIIEKFRAMRAQAPRFLHALEFPPVANSTPELVFRFAALDSSGRRNRNVSRLGTLPALGIEYHEGRPSALFDYDMLVRMLEAAGVKDTWDVSLYVKYSVPAGTGKSDFTRPVPNISDDVVSMTEDEEH